MIAQRAPTVSRSGNAVRRRSSCSSSPLTAIRSAWNVRVAGWIFDLRCSAIGIAEATTVARSVVVVIVFAATASLIRRAIFLEWRSSPSSKITSASESGSSSSISSSAVWPRVGSIRMSSGPGFMNENPRSP